LQFLSLRDFDDAHWHRRRQHRVAIFIALSIGVGVLCGLDKGEWKGASGKVRILLWEGLALIALAVIIIQLGNRH
jgi:hypothetical protein